jgi:hypothetical protein
MNTMTDTSSIAPLSGNAPKEPRVIDLAPESELRIEVEFGYTLDVKASSLVIH